MADPCATTVMAAHNKLMVLLFTDKKNVWSWLGDEEPAIL